MGVIVVRFALIKTLNGLIKLKFMRAVTSEVYRCYGEINFCTFRPLKAFIALCFQHIKAVSKIMQRGKIIASCKSLCLDTCNKLCFYFLVKVA